MADYVIETDVLVVGGGLSGIFAGIKARELGVDVTVVEKGHVGKTGAALFANNTSIFNPQWGHNLNDWQKQIAETGDYMNNPEWTEITLRESYARYQDMVSFGIQYPRGKDGELVMLPQRGALTDFATFRGSEWMPALRRPLIKSGARVMDRIMVTDLMKQDGRVVGAVGFDTRSGDFYVFKAKATVMCTGGGSLGFAFSTYDGEAMAYRAGAEISGKEFSISGTGPFSYMGSGYGYYGDRKDPVRMSLEGKEIRPAPPGFGPSMFIDKYVDSAGYKINRYTLASAVHQGRAPIFWNLDDAAPADIEAAEKFSGRSSVDLRKGGLYQVPMRMEIYVGWQVHCAAGIASAGTDASTSLPGLYAAGDGYNSRAVGAKYVHRGFGTRNAMVVGTIAGQSAAKFAQQIREAKVDAAQVARLRSATFAPLERKSGFDQEWILQQLKSISHPYYVWFVRKGDRLQAALTMVEFVKNHLTAMMYARPGDAHGLRLAHETAGRVVSTGMMLRAALFRTESRGVHYREDYPHRDDPNWLAQVKVTDKKGEMTLTREPLPRKHWPDLSKPYATRYPLEYLGEEPFRASK